MSRELRHSPPLSRSAVVNSGGSLRRSSDRTNDAGSGLEASGPETTSGTAPANDSRVKKPTVASRPTMNRRMISPRPESEGDLGAHQIGPKRPYGVKHGAC